MQPGLNRKILYQKTNNNKYQKEGTRKCLGKSYKSVCVIYMINKLHIQLCVEI